MIHSGYEYEEVNSFKPYELICFLVVGAIVVFVLWALFA